MFHHNILGGGLDSSSISTQGPLFSINFFDCNTYYDSLMVANNYFFIMFAYEIKFYKYTSPKEVSHFGSMTEETYVPLETIIATDTNF